jgi:hypothetical protein
MNNLNQSDIERICKQFFDDFRGVLSWKWDNWARIVALPDVYDALTSKRIYKEPFPHKKAKKMIVDEKRCSFDTDVVDAFLTCEDDFLKILNAG